MLSMAVNVLAEELHDGEVALVAAQVGADAVVTSTALRYDEFGGRHVQLSSAMYLCDDSAVFTPRLAYSPLSSSCEHLSKASEF